MSNEYINDVRAIDGISSPAKFVLFILADHATAEGIAWPSLKTIQRETLLCRATVCKVLNELDRCGLIERTHGGRTTRYVLHTADAASRARAFVSVTQTSPSHGHKRVSVHDTDQLVRHTDYPSPSHGHKPLYNPQEPKRRDSALQGALSSSIGADQNVEPDLPPAATTLEASPLAAMVERKKTASEEKRCTMTNLRKAQLAARGIPTDGMSLEQMSARLLECQMAEAESKTQVNGQDYAPT